jgi:uncharacterized protein (TIGR03905 family)
MTDSKNQRYIFKTHGVCPPEIHFQIDRDCLADVRFVGGGCPGNALLSGRLLRNRHLDEILGLISGIECRNGTSCPDQLALAIKAVTEGRLAPAASFMLAQDLAPKNRVGLIGELDGDMDVLKQIVAAMTQAGVETILCMGNLTGALPLNRHSLKEFRKLSLQAIQGPNDWNYANGTEKPALPSMDHQWRDCLIQLPQALNFQIAGKQCLAFYGDFIQSMPGYSDYEPYALEMNMVCGLTDFMQDESVFPALAAMTPQFCTDVVLFSQLRRWAHWQVGGKDFISVGPATDGDCLTWGVLEPACDKLKFHTVRWGDSSTRGL